MTWKWYAMGSPEQIMSHISLWMGSCRCSMGGGRGEPFLNFFEDSFILLESQTYRETERVVFHVLVQSPQMVATVSYPPKW